MAKGYVNQWLGGGQIATKTDSPSNSKASDPNYRLYGAIAITAVAILALIGKLWAQSVNPALKLDDAVTLGLLILAIAPWVAPFVETLKVGSWEFKFSRLARKQEAQEQQLQEQQQELEGSGRLLLGIIRGMVGDEGEKLLNQLQRGESIPYKYSDATKSDYRKMLRQLRLLGFIKIDNNEDVSDIIDDKRPEVDLGRVVHLTSGGHDYLQSRLPGLRTPPPPALPNA